MGDNLGAAIIGVVIFLALLVAFVPAITDNIANADDQRACTTAGFEFECLDNDDGMLNWCSNETDGTLHCTNAALPIFNVSTQLCTNASGVGVVNGTPTSVCDSTGWAAGIVAYEDVGLSPIETTMLGLVILFLVLGGVFGLIKATGLGGK